MEKQIFEIAMLVCFGVAWPFSIHKSWKSRTTAGKSALFLGVILAGYLFGITNKLVNRQYQLVLVFYIGNLIMVGTDLALWFRNRGLEGRVS